MHPNYLDTDKPTPSRAFLIWPTTAKNFFLDNGKDLSVIHHTCFPDYFGVAELSSSLSLINVYQIVDLATSNVLPTSLMRLS